MADLDRVRAAKLMRTAGIDALVLFQPEHVAYAIGAAAGVATMWRRGGGAVAIVPSDESSPVTALIGDVNAAAVRAASPTVDVRAHRVWVDAVDLTGLDEAGAATVDLVEAGYRRGATASGAALPRPATFDLGRVLGLLADALADRGLSRARLAADLTFLPAIDYLSLINALPDPTWSDGSEIIGRLRAIKSAAEIDRLRRAAALAETGLEALVAGVAPGRSARDLARIWRNGIAAAAEREHMPDLTGSWDYISVGPDPWSGNGVIAAGSIIKADVGCLVGGYSSDGARTFVYGAPSVHAATLFAILKDAFEAGLAQIRPGTAFRDIHASTIDVIHRAGIMGYDRGHFGHSVGADIGIEEWPFISAGSDMVAEPGMVLAFEVPFYGKGIGALMIEDQGLVTDTGFEPMNRLPRGLLRID